jgi:hypothetical protein
MEGAGERLDVRPPRPPPKPAQHTDRFVDALEEMADRVARLQNHQPGVALQCERLVEVAQERIGVEE